jgi:hypothetical protein
MAVTAGSPLLVPGMVPALIDRVHHVAVITGHRVIPQVGCEIGDNHPHTEYNNQGSDAHNERELHWITFMQILYLELHGSRKTIKKPV